MNVLFRIFYCSASLVFLASCGFSNPAIEKLKEIHSAAQAAESIDELYPYFTNSSQEYFEYLTQKKEETIAERLWAGNNYGLMFTTAILAKQGENTGDSIMANFNRSLLLISLKNSGNPVFSWDQEPLVKEDLSECCNPSLVTVLEKVDNSTFLTKKILFEGAEEDLKLDVLSTLKSEENLWKQAFAQFKDPSLRGATSQQDMRRIATLSARANHQDPDCIKFVEAVLAGKVVGGSMIYKR